MKLEEDIKKEKEKYSTKMKELKEIQDILENEFCKLEI